MHYYADNYTPIIKLKDVNTSSDIMNVTEKKIMI